MRLIDADKAREKSTIDLITHFLDRQPTIEAEPVKYGQWEEYPDSAHLRCTHCKIEFKKEKMPHTKNYCPKCGAKMNLEEE